MNPYYEFETNRHLSLMHKDHDVYFVSNGMGISAAIMIKALLTKDAVDIDSMFFSLAKKMGENGMNTLSQGDSLNDWVYTAPKEGSPLHYYKNDLGVTMVCIRSLGGMVQEFMFSLHH